MFSYLFFCPAYVNSCLKSNFGVWRNSLKNARFSRPRVPIICSAHGKHSRASSTPTKKYKPLHICRYPIRRMIFLTASSQQSSWCKNIPSMCEHGNCTVVLISNGTARILLSLAVKETQLLLTSKESNSVSMTLTSRLQHRANMQKRNRDHDREPDLLVGQCHTMSFGRS